MPEWINIVNASFATNYLERLNETDWPSWNYADSKMQKTTVRISPTEKE